MGAVIVFRDISQRIETEERLRANEQERQLILDNVPALIASFGLDQCYRFANKSYMNLHGFTPVVSFLKFKLRLSCVFLPLHGDISANNVFINADRGYKVALLTRFHLDPNTPWRETCTEP